MRGCPLLLVADPLSRQLVRPQPAADQRSDGLAAAEAVGADASVLRAAMHASDGAHGQPGRTGGLTTANAVGATAASTAAATVAGLRLLAQSKRAFIQKVEALEQEVLIFPTEERAAES